MHSAFVCNSSYPFQIHWTGMNPRGIIIIIMFNLNYIREFPKEINDPIFVNFDIFASGSISTWGGESCHSLQNAPTARRKLSSHTVVFICGQIFSILEKCWNTWVFEIIQTSFEYEYQFILFTIIRTFFSIYLRQWKWSHCDLVETEVHEFGGKSICKWPRINFDILLSLLLFLSWPTISSR